MSAVITRASISSVTPGSVAIRAPASLASRRASVCESDLTVGQRTTSAFAMAAATGPGGSSPWTERSAISISIASAPARPASPRIRSAIPRVDGFATTSTDSPSRTARQSLITVETARSRSLIGSRLSPATIVASAMNGDGTTLFDELLWVHGMIRRDLEAVRELATVTANGGVG